MDSELDVAFAHSVSYAVLYQLTPLQRSEADKFLETWNHEPRDPELVTKQRTVIEEHYERLAGNFLTSYVRIHLMQEITHAFWHLIALDYDGGPDLDLIPFSKHIKAHGSTSQCQQALDEFNAVDESTMHDLVSDALDFTLPEMFVDRDYYLQRAQAACNNSSLITDLKTAGKWNELQTLLAKDKTAMQNLGAFIKKGPICNTQHVADIERLTLLEIDRLLEHAAGQLTDSVSSMGVKATEDSLVKKRPTTNRVANLFKAMHLPKHNLDGHGEGDGTRPLLYDDESKKTL